jgi:TetR/AcrR family transcriptional repressor of nem operon
MLQAGYDGVGISSILSSTGVPKGSFYHYFESKEAFGCAIVAAYAESWRAVRRKTFQRPDLPYLERLEAHFIELEEDVRLQEGLGGCLLGNLSQLMASRSKRIRLAVETAFQEWQDDLIEVLDAAERAGELQPDAASDETATLIIEAYEGALIRSKAQASLEPLVRFRKKSLKRLLLT